jgi:hypothetical protein
LNFFTTTLKFASPVLRERKLNLSWNELLS